MIYELELTQPVAVSQLEALYLWDAVSEFAQVPTGSVDQTTGQQSMRPVFPEFHEKINIAVLETEASKTPFTIQVTEAELWAMREVIKSSVVVGSERVGVSLALKVAKALVDMKRGYNVANLATMLQDVEIEDDKESDDETDILSPNG